MLNPGSGFPETGFTRLCILYRRFKSQALGQSFLHLGSDDKENS